MVDGLEFSQLLHRNVQRFRGGLVFKAYRGRTPAGSASPEGTPSAPSHARTQNSKFPPGESAGNVSRVIAASEQRDFFGFKDFHLKAQARIWPWLPYLRRIRSTAAGPRV